MTTLYRTPNMVIGENEWHASVRKKDGRVSRAFYFRPLGGKAAMWSHITNWQGRKPTWKEFDRAFGQFKRHMTLAERSIVENARKAREQQEGRA